MGYKVNRIGTPFFGNDAASVVKALAAGEIAAWDELKTAQARAFVTPVASSYAQFGISKGVLTGTDAMTQNNYIAFGQQAVAPEIRVGNAVLVELTAEIYGQLNDVMSISHMVGLVATPSPAAWDRAVTSPNPLVLHTENAISNTEKPSYRRFTSKQVVMLHATTLALSAGIIGNFVELADVRYDGAATYNIGNLRMQFGMRSINNADVIQPYDPSR